MNKNIRNTMLALLTGLALSSQAAFAQSSTTTTTTTNTAGTISEFGPSTIVIKSETAAEPVRYTYSKTTTYVDESGNPVSMELVKSGLPVTVYYTKDGDNMIATKVVVRKVTTTSDGAVEKKSSTTTTTTDK